MSAILHAYHTGDASKEPVVLSQCVTAGWLPADSRPISFRQEQMRQKIELKLIHAMTYRHVQAISNWGLQIIIASASTAIIVPHGYTLKCFLSIMCKNKTVPKYVLVYILSISDLISENMRRGILGAAADRDHLFPLSSLSYPLCALHGSHVIAYLQFNETVFMTWKKLALELSGCRCHKPGSLLYIGFP